MMKTSANLSRWGLNYNLGLLLKQLSKGWLLTLLVVLAITGLSAYQLSQNPNFTPPEIAVAIVGIVAALGFMKACLLLMSYRLMNQTPFEGSFFVMALLVTLLLIIALSALSFLVSSRVDDFPTSDMVWMLPAVFGIVTVFLFVTFRASNWMFRR